MSFLQALLIALWAGFCSYDDQGPQMLRRPLLVGTMVGIILNDITAGLIVSGTLELMWMGLGNMAGYRTPDMIIGTIVGVTAAIQSGSGTTPEGIAAGVASATLVALLAQQLLVMFDLFKQFLAPWADRVALSGNFNGIMVINYVAITLQFLIRAVPTFLVVYFSDAAINSVLSVVPQDVLAALGVATKLLTAVGLSILMTMMMKAELWAFLLFGFVCAAYLKLSILPITLLSLAFAVLYSMIKEGKENKQVSVASETVVEEEVYDL